MVPPSYFARVASIFAFIVCPPAARATSPLRRSPSSATSNLKAPLGTGTSIVTLFPSTAPFSIGNCSPALGPAVPVSFPPSCFKIRWIVSSWDCPSGPVICNVPLHVPETSAALAARAKTTDNKTVLSACMPPPLQSSAVGGTTPARPRRASGGAGFSLPTPACGRIFSQHLRERLHHSLRRRGLHRQGAKLNVLNTFFTGEWWRVNPQSAYCEDTAI